MAANLHLDIRPPRPPKQNPSAEAADLFHPAITSPTPITLSPALLEQYDVAKREAAQALADRTGKPGDNVMIIPLGTGSAAPTKYRNGWYPFRHPRAA